VEITDRVHPPMRVPDPTLRLTEIHVRREGLTIRVEVRDLPPLALSQQGELELKTNTQLTREIDRLTIELHNRLVGKPAR
jgi:hypothetical protein